jgi:hypothetical protein
MCRCLSRKPETVHRFDCFRFPPHVGPADFSIFRHAISTSRRLLQCDGTSHRRVDHPAGRRRLPMGRGSAVSPARPGPDLQRLVSAAGAAHGDRRSPHRPPESVAESLCGAADREYPPGVSGPGDYPARATPQATPDRVLSVLPSLAYAPGAGDGLSAAAAGTTAGGWTDPGSTRGRWVASPL